MLFRHGENSTGTAAEGDRARKVVGVHVRFHHGDDSPTATFRDAEVHRGPHGRVDYCRFPVHPTTYERQPLPVRRTWTICSAGSPDGTSAVFQAPLHSLIPPESE